MPRKALDEGFPCYWIRAEARHVGYLASVDVLALELLVRRKREIPVDAVLEEFHVKILVAPRFDAVKILPGALPSESLAKTPKRLQVVLSGGPPRRALVEDLQDDEVPAALLVLCGSETIRLLPIAGTGAPLPIRCSNA